MDVQGKVRNFFQELDKATGYQHDKERTIIHLIEELGELAKCMRKNDNQGVEREIADVFLLLVHLANLSDVDIERAVNRRILSLKERHGLG